MPLIIPGSASGLQTYIAAYGHNAKITHLIHIATNEGPMQLSAYQLVIDVLKAGTNTQYYLEVVSMGRQAFGEALGDRWGLDQAWVDATNRRAREAMLKAETEVARADRDGERGALYRATVKLAECHAGQGGYSKAISTYFSAKKLLASAADEWAINLGVIRASMDIGTLSQVQSQAQRALQRAQSPTSWQPEVTACMGLAFLKNKSYSLAAAQFLKTNVTTDHFCDRITPRDVVMYGCVCALASYSRGDLKARLLENDDFKKLVLDVAPEWLGIVRAYCTSDYAGCFSALAAKQGELLRDVHVGPQWKNLEGKIKDCALVLYFRPFSSVRLQSMADAFCVPLDEMEQRLVNLISNGQITARIDAHSKVLYSRNTDTRTASFEQAVRLGNKYIRDIKSLLMRVSLARSNVVVRPKSERDERAGGHDQQLAATLAASLNDQ